MSESLLVTAAAADFDEALVAVVRLVARHKFAQPQVSILPAVLPPDDTHVDPWAGFRVVVAGLVDVPYDLVPILAPWPPPKEGAT